LINLLATSTTKMHQYMSPDKLESLLDPIKNGFIKTFLEA
jgi:hypothetical protein